VFPCAPVAQLLPSPIFAVLGGVQVSTQGGVSVNGGSSLQGVTVRDNYLEQASGLFVAPLTTTYRFYLQSVLQSDLFLSTDASPVNLKPLCTVTYMATQYVTQPSTLFVRGFVWRVVLSLGIALATPVASTPCPVSLAGTSMVAAFLPPWPWWPASATSTGRAWRRRLGTVPTCRWQCEL
jgi:hypothetical protein